MEAGPIRDMLEAADWAVLVCAIAMLADETSTLHTTYADDGFTCAALVFETQRGPTIASMMGRPVAPA